MAARPWSSLVRAFARVWTRPVSEQALESTRDSTPSDDESDFDDPLLRAVAAAPAIPLRPPAAQWMPRDPHGDLVSRGRPPKRRG
jgi:hypothetical protein